MSSKWSIISFGRPPDGPVQVHELRLTVVASVGLVGAAIDKVRVAVDGFALLQEKPLPALALRAPVLRRDIMSLFSCSFDELGDERGRIVLVIQDECAPLRPG